VKTLADPEAERVKLNSPETTTIEKLCALPVPTYAAPNPRSTFEESVFTVDGYLVGFTLAADSDFHAVIRDAAGETLIIEFPNPGCLQGSKVIQQAVAARTRFLKLIGTLPTDHFVFLPKAIRVRVTGVVFFDRIHGQDGVAPNGVELHPVIGFEGSEVSSSQ
jgi:hypothetical protein